MLTKIETEILSAIMEINGKSETVRAIEKRTTRCYATVYSTVKLMESKGLLITAVQGRRRSVELTSKGKIIVEQIKVLNNALM